MAGDVVRSLERQFELHGRPACLRSGDGPELVADEARGMINQWIEEYHTIRQHGALGGLNREHLLQHWIEGNEMIQ